MGCRTRLLCRLTRLTLSRVWTGQPTSPRPVFVSEFFPGVPPGSYRGSTRSSRPVPVLSSFPVTAVAERAAAFLSVTQRQTPVIQDQKDEDRERPRVAAGNVIGLVLDTLNFTDTLINCPSAYLCDWEMRAEKD